MAGLPRGDVVLGLDVLLQAVQESLGAAVPLAAHHYHVQWPGRPGRWCR